MKGMDGSVLSLQCFFKVISKLSLLKLLRKVLREELDARLFRVYPFISLQFLNYVNILHIKIIKADKM